MLRVTSFPYENQRYPMSILTGGLGINITCLSYVDHIDFSIALDPDLVPDSLSLIDELEIAFEEYITLIKPMKKKVATRKVSRAVKPKPDVNKKTATKKKAVVDK